MPNSCRSAVAKRRCRSTPLTALFATLKLWFFMRMIFAVILALLPLALIGNAQAAARGQFTVQASSGGILVESFASSAGGPHPAVLILTEARGLAHPPMMKSDGSLARLISIPTLCMCFPSRSGGHHQRRKRQRPHRLLYATAIGLDRSRSRRGVLSQYSAPSCREGWRARHIAGAQINIRMTPPLANHLTRNRGARSIVFPTKPQSRIFRISLAASYQAAGRTCCRTRPEVPELQRRRFDLQCQAAE